MEGMPWGWHETLKLKFWPMLKPNHPQALSGVRHFTEPHHVKDTTGHTLDRLVLQNYWAWSLHREGLCHRLGSSVWERDSYKSSEATRPPRSLCVPIAWQVISLSECSWQCRWHAAGRGAVMWTRTSNVCTPKGRQGQRSAVRQWRGSWESFSRLLHEERQHACEDIKCKARRMNQSKWRLRQSEDLW